MRFKFRFVLCFFLLYHFIMISSGEGKETLSRKERFPIVGLEKQVNFWKKIYTQYTTNQAVIHDTNDLDIIYEVIDFKKVFGDVKITDDMKRRLIKKTKEKYRDILKDIEKGAPNLVLNNTSDIELTTKKRVYELVKKDFTRAAENIRAQIGQRDKFEKGLRLSGLYIDKIKEIFREFDLPEELTVLPHVESSFQINAYSKFGAAGIWQFTRSTGRLFMRINYEVDERLDPIISSIAAAKLLKMNYEELGNWPLAITAYNHGLAGMKRAKREIGSDEIVDVINGYNSRIFGFASENFYAEFLAALEVVKDYKRYFGDIDLEDPIRYEIFELPEYINISTITKYFNIHKEEIAFLNPALRIPVLSSQKLIPKGFKLRIPEGIGNKVSSFYAQISQEERYKGQDRTTLISKIVKIDTNNDIPSPSPSSKKEEHNVYINKKEKSIEWIEVDHDETLGHYAEWLKLPTQTIRNLNRLRYGKEIKIGQRIRLSFVNTTPQEFEEKRREYHKGIEEDFFNAYFVENTIITALDAGQGVWDLCREIYEIPYWLLKKYNQDKDLFKLHKGESLVIPIVSTK
ncbi:MAG: lytic transglycosylase domain-containing protein [Nitrospinae bacterium]|nr:lytic transglycosylase domain-containing protein [Nitrospinota bacterium]